MNHWNAFPFVRFVFWLMVGILLAMETALHFLFYWQIVIFLSLSWLSLNLLKNKIPNFLVIQGVLAATLFLVLGFGITREKQASVRIDQIPEKESYWLIEAVTDGNFTPKTIKLEAEILALKGGEGWKRSNGKLILYIKKEGMQVVPGHGECFVIKARLKPVPEPLNPSVFNYKAYLGTKGINYQSFVSSEKIILAGGSPRYPWMVWAGKIQDQASISIQKWVEGRREAAIVKALVLGDRGSLDNEIKQAYATAGAMHVLAVSGLHVGFIYMLLNFLFRYWVRHPYLKWLSFVLVLIVLWSYALLTGLSPSVLRAVWMFSMLDLALKMKRKSGTYNALAVAAFFLLLFNPYNLKSVGFQLSFLAVTGIVYLGPRLISLYKGENRLLKYLWALLTISVAAQIATFPLSLYYFGQFPTYFFITNLIVVPAAGIILGLGLLLLVSSLINNVLAAAVGWCLSGLMLGVNSFIYLAERLPYSKLSGFIGGFQLLLLTGIILGVLLLLHYRKFSLGIVVFLFGAFFLGNLLYVSWQRKDQKKLVVYHIPNYTVLHFIDGRGEFFLADTALPQDRLKFQVQPHRADLGLGGFEQENRVKSGFKPALYKTDAYTLLIWRGISLLYIRSDLEAYPEGEEPIQVDYILISRNAVKDLVKIHTWCKAKKIVIDGSNQRYVVNSLRQQAAELDLLCHITAEKGAFELDLE